MTIFCDAHVHCYDLEELPSLMDFAWNNFNRFSKDSDKDDFLIFFTDGVFDRGWHATKKAAMKNQKIGDWKLRINENTNFIEGVGKEARRLYFAPARQLNSSEKLEFLILGDESFELNGAPAKTIIEEKSSEYLVICPWGAGKWMFARNKFLKQLRTGELRGSFFLGDNGGRPWVWKREKILSHPKQIIINGSDPLPLVGEVKRVGSFGTAILGDKRLLSLREIVDRLSSEETELVNFGKHQSMLAFLVSQLRLLSKKSID